MIHIRDLQNADYDSLRRHFAACWHDTYAQELGATDVAKMVATLDRPHLGLLAPDAVALAAIEEVTDPGPNAVRHRIVGTAIAAERYGICYIWGMYVAPDRHRRGIGGRLLDALDLRVKSATTCSVTVLRASHAAQKFYRDRGFSEESSSAYELSPGIVRPAIVMTCDRSIALKSGP